MIPLPSTAGRTTGTGLIRSTGLISGSPTAITSMGLCSGLVMISIGFTSGSGKTGPGRIGSGRTGGGITTGGGIMMGSLMVLSASSTTATGSTVSMGSTTVSGMTGA